MCFKAPQVFNSMVEYLVRTIFSALSSSVTCKGYLLVCCYQLLYGYWFWHLAIGFHPDIHRFSLRELYCMTGFSGREFSFHILTYFRGLAFVLELLAGLVEAILDVISRPTYWGLSVELVSKLSFSDAYFPNQNHLLRIFVGAFFVEDFIHLAHATRVHESLGEGSISKLIQSLNLSESPNSELRVLITALSLMCFKAPQVFNSMVEYLVRTIFSALSSSVTCKGYLLVAVTSCCTGIGFGILLLVFIPTYTGFSLLLFWYLDPLTLKQDVSKILQDTKKAFPLLERRISPENGLMCYHYMLSAFSCVFIETRALLHDWFLRTGLAFVLELLAGLVEAIWMYFETTIGAYLELDFIHLAHATRVHESLGAEQLCPIKLTALSVGSVDHKSLCSQKNFQFKFSLAPKSEKYTIRNYVYICSKFDLATHCNGATFKKKLKKPKVHNKREDFLKKEYDCHMIEIWLDQFETIYLFMLQNVLLRRILLGILIGSPGSITEDGCALLLHYAATGKILRPRETMLAGPRHVNRTLRDDLTTWIENVVTKMF
ncbi:Beta-galactosidase [Hibiscus syriacus]|uniref:Beta-galactosidase n=1 Tax=Hibiscus syriacus TaxID=106335 RepID=A0A6A3BQI4_HIBSY|nr:Beta-galactosidase [Hibiscus syriacus]